METYENPDLRVGADNFPEWYQAHNRRHGYHHLGEIHKYGLTFRSARVLTLTPAEDERISHMDLVRDLTNDEYFSALCVIREGKILFESYAKDFGPGQCHSIQSTNKIMINLLVGKWVGEGKLDLSSKVVDHFPELEGGYGGNTIQDLLDMQAFNDYSESFDNPGNHWFLHEEVYGWRLARNGNIWNREFLKTIRPHPKNPQQGGGKLQDRQQRRTVHDH